jgi:hypothetical protein
MAIEKYLAENKRLKYIKSITHPSGLRPSELTGCTLYTTKFWRRGKQDKQDRGAAGWAG